MTQPDSGPSWRLYGMMQYLMTQAARGNQPEAAPDRGVVTGDDAAVAILHIAAVLDEAVQAGRIPLDRGVHAAAMLMVIRDYVRPLPPGISQDGTDRVAGDLAELVKIFREPGGSIGVRG